MQPAIPDTSSESELSDFYVKNSTYFSDKVSTVLDSDYNLFIYVVSRGGVDESLVAKGVRTLKDEGIYAFLSKSKSYLIYKIKSPLALFIGIILKYTIPTDSDLVIFDDGGHCTFTGNKKYLYLGLSSEYNKRCVWLTECSEIAGMLDEAGLNACRRDSIRGRVLSLRAEYAVTENRYFEVSNALLYNSIKIQTFHGVPLKQLWDDKMPWWKKKLNRYDYACVSGQVEEEAFRRFLHINKVIYTGAPRNDILFNEIEDSELGIDQTTSELVQSVSDDECIIGYFPTWRPDNPNTNLLELEELNDFLKSHDAHFLVKPHPLWDPFGNVTEYSRIHKSDKNQDTYPLFKHIDIMVTDYSSIYFDFLLLDKPVVFYPFDYEEYSQEWGFNLPYERTAPGPKCSTFDDLLMQIEYNINNDDFGQHRKEVRDLVYDCKQGEAIDRIYNEIF